MWRLRAPLLALLLMQVILLASSGVTATKKPLGKQETCNMKNHMIEYLRNNGVQIYERPQINTDICESEWTHFGTCCDPEDTVRHVQEKIELNNMALAAVVQEMNSLEGRLVSFRKAHFTNVMGNGISFKTAGKGTKEKGKSGKKDKDKKTDKQKEVKFQQIGKAIIDSLPQNIQNQQKCVAKINSVISKSACSICSGRSDDFFNTVGSLKVSEPLCRDVLQDCSEAWVSMVQMAAEVRGYTSRIRAQRVGSDEDGILEEKGFTMNLDSFITNRNLIPILRSCRGTSLVKCSFEHVAALCEQFIHIQAPTYIESSQSQAQKILTSFKATDGFSNRRLLWMRKDFQEIDLLSKQGSVSGDPNASRERFWKSVRLLPKIQKMKTNWITMQLEVPVLKLILEQTSKQNLKAWMSRAISQAQKLLTQIENTIAAAALRAHNVIREMVFNPSSPQAKIIAEKNWDLICSLVERTKFPIYEDQSIKQRFEELEAIAKEKHRLAVKSQKSKGDWLSAHQLFMQALKTRIVEIIPQREIQQESIIKDTPAPANTLAPPGPPLATQPRVLSNSIIQESSRESQTSEISVIIDAQCNPCLSPSDSSILEGP